MSVFIWNKLMMCWYTWLLLSVCSINPACSPLHFPLKISYLYSVYCTMKTFLYKCTLRLVSGICSGKHTLVFSFFFFYTKLLGAADRNILTKYNSSLELWKLIVQFASGHQLDTWQQQMIIICRSYVRSVDYSLVLVRKQVRHFPSRWNCWTPSQHE